MMGLMFPVYTAPVLSLVFVAWAAATRRMADGPRRVALVGRDRAGLRLLDHAAQPTE